MWILFSANATNTAVATNIYWDSTNSTATTDDALFWYNVRPQEQTRDTVRAHRERVAAQRRARRLLLSCLSQRQQKEYRETQAFTVVGSRGQRYLIKKGRQHNVFRIGERGQSELEFCITLDASLPDEDVMLAQKLLLEVDEEEFFRRSNVWRLTPRRDLIHSAVRQVA